MSEADDTQVLRFTLGEDSYCVDIDYVAEIVDGEQMTGIPNAPDHVEGVMDLRGQTTTIVNPCAVLETDSVTAEELVTDGGVDQNRVIVLDGDTVAADGTTGWVVSDVDEVTTVSEDMLEADEIGDTELLRGLIKEDDGFTLWLNPNELTA